MALTLRRHWQYSFMLLFFVWAALIASFSALLTFSDNPTAINIYGFNMEKWATSPVYWYTVILEVFILCVRHKKEKVKGKEVKHCQRPHWRNRGLSFSVLLILIKDFEQSICAAVQHSVCAGWGYITFVQQICDSFWAQIDSLRVWVWHILKKGK